MSDVECNPHVWYRLRNRQQRLIPAWYCARCAFVVISLVTSTTSAIASELFGLGGMMQSRNADRNDSSYSWQLEYREELNEYVAASLSYLNDGHVPSHHRDGNALQLWLKSDVFDRRLSLSAGIGPYYYFDTTTSENSGGSYSNQHGFAGAFSLAAVWQTEAPHHAPHDQDSDRIVSMIATMTGSYRLDPNWSLRTSWNRIVTNYDRDADVIMVGLGYRF